MNSFFKVFEPIQHLWWKVFGDTLVTLLSFIYSHVHGIAIFDFIGSYGIAIIVVTIIIRLVLAPLQQFQLVTQRKTMAEQRKLAPEVAELRKKYKKEPQKLNAEMMKLYQEHGINPLGGMIGCLPLVVQIPILTALFYVFRDWAPHAHVVAHFLFIPNLNDNPSSHTLIHGLPIPDLAYLIFPLLAGITTLIQTRMLQMPLPPNPTDQEAQTQQMQRTMLWISPLMIGYFALNVPAGLGLYWFIGNCVSIIQQSFVVGWGNVLPARFRTVAGGSPSLPGKASGLTPKNSPKNLPKNLPRNGSKPKKPKRQQG
jgi:YidC/Oxa1 family membrane protein insertase